jgi:hypothetical protein
VRREYYKIKLSAFEGPYLTVDADFLGTKTEAEVIAKEQSFRVRRLVLSITHNFFPGIACADCRAKNAGHNDEHLLASLKSRGAMKLAWTRAQTIATGIF